MTEQKYTFFWGKASPFSQWYKCKFTVDYIVFSSAEQAMMYFKAILFGDIKMSKKILQTYDPKECKALGRRVENFDELVWIQTREEIVYRINKAKFTQNKHLCNRLLATKGTILVEASPYDKIWGIGLSESDLRAKDENQWRGQNLLGKILTELREEILSKGRQ